MRLKCKAHCSDVVTVAEPGRPAGRVGSPEARRPVLGRQVGHQPSDNHSEASRLAHLTNKITLAIMGSIRWALQLNTDQHPKPFPSIADVRWRHSPFLTPTTPYGKCCRCRSLSRRPSNAMNPRIVAKLQRQGPLTGPVWKSWQEAYDATAY